MPVVNGTHYSYDAKRKEAAKKARKKKKTKKVKRKASRKKY